MRVQKLCVCKTTTSMSTMHEFEPYTQSRDLCFHVPARDTVAQSNVTQTKKKGG